MRSLERPDQIEMRQILPGAGVPWGIRLILFAGITLFFQISLWDKIPNTGDEPHYMLAILSLVQDHDWNLANQYRNGDYRRFGYPVLYPQQPVSAYMPPDHGVGMPAFSAIPYAIAGESGARWFLIAIALLGIAAVSATAEILTKSSWVALWAGSLLAFSPTWQSQAGRFYPEIAAGTIVAVVLWLLASRRSPVLAGFLVALLPIFHTKYAPIALALALVYLTVEKRFWIGAVLGGALAATLFASAYGLHPLAGNSNPGLVNLSLAGAFGRAWRAWLDAGQGPLAFQPVFAVFIWAAWRVRGRVSYAAVLVVTLYSILHGLFIGHSGETIPGRNLCAALPAAALVIGVWAAKAGAWAACLLAILGSVGAYLTVAAAYLHEMPWRLLPLWHSLWPSYVPAPSFVPAGWPGRNPGGTGFVITVAVALGLWFSKRFTAQPAAVSAVTEGASGKKKTGDIELDPLRRRNADVSTITVSKPTNMLTRGLDYVRAKRTPAVIVLVVLALVAVAIALYISRRNPISRDKSSTDASQVQIASPNESPPWRLGFGGGAKPWTIEGKGISTTSAFSGCQYCLMEKGDGGGVYRFVGGLAQGQTYQIEAFTRSDAGTKGQAVFSIHDTTGTHLIWAPKHTPMSNDWEKVTLNFTATSTGAVAIHLYYSGGPGAIYWREVGIVKE